MRYGWSAAVFAGLCAAWLGEATARAVPQDLPALCDTAARTAAARTGVPEPVLRAIALTETGRRIDGRHRPWPWTVNMQGKGRWFDSRDKALAHVRDHHAKGARSYDIGCFQINYRWHGEAFDSVEQMFDPTANALYAAQFLAALHAETGSWTKAAGAYHSRTPKFAARYTERFERILVRLDAGPLPPPPPAQPDPEPVAVAGAAIVDPPAAARLGSLMPLDAYPRAQPLLTGARGPLY